VFTASYRPRLRRNCSTFISLTHALHEAAVPLIKNACFAQCRLTVYVYLCWLNRTTTGVIPSCFLAFLAFNTRTSIYSRRSAIVGYNYLVLYVRSCNVRRPAITTSQTCITPGYTPCISHTTDAHGGPRNHPTTLLSLITRHRDRCSELFPWHIRQ